MLDYNPLGGVTLLSIKGINTPNSEYIANGDISHHQPALLIDKL